MVNSAGIVLWNREAKCYGVFFGLWYLDKNPYNADCYGKFISINNDQGMRMELVPIDQNEAIYDSVHIERWKNDGQKHELMKSNFDPLTGETYPAWDTMNTTAEPESPKAEQCLYHCTFGSQRI